MADVPVTVTASNSGGSATTGFRVTVAAPLAAPVAVGGIPDQILEQDSGPRTVSAQAAFRGEALGFALDAAPAGVGIDAGSGLVTIATDTALAAAPVIVRASNAAGAATQGFAVSVRSTVTAFDEGDRLAELGFVAEAAAPAFTQEAGFARLVPALASRVHGDWTKAAGDGRYRCLARWGDAGTQTVNRPFWLSARFRQAGGNAFGVRADIFGTAGGNRQLQLRQYTGAGSATAVIASAAVVGWAWDAWQWVELEIEGTIGAGAGLSRGRRGPGLAGRRDHRPDRRGGLRPRRPAGQRPEPGDRSPAPRGASAVRSNSRHPRRAAGHGLGHCSSHGADMKYSIVFKLKDGLAEAVAVEWTDRADPRGSADGWEPCVRLLSGDWRISSYGATDGRAAHWRDPGLFDNVGLRYRLAAAGPWSAVSEGRKAITIVAVTPAALAAADWTPLAPADAGGAIGAFALHGAAAGAGAVQWSRAGAADWQPCLALGDGRWRPAATAGLAGEPLVLRYAFAAEGPWSPASPDAKVLVTGLPFWPFWLAAPALAGTGRIGTEIGVDPGLWVGDPLPSLALQWRCDGVDIPGATGPVFVPGPAEDGRRAGLRRDREATSRAAPPR